MQANPECAPGPDGGWSEQIWTHENALIVPPVAPGRVLQAGVFDRAGHYRPEAAVWRREEPVTLPPARPDQADDTLTGRWLWGGVLFHHFGHFQVESLARLWPLAGGNTGFDGVVFSARGVNKGLKGWQRDFLGLLIGDLPVRVVFTPTRVETLVIPGQGFGLGKIASGTGAFRRFIHHRFAPDVAPQGPERLFISRSQQGLSQGGFVGEAILDDRMERAGFTPFFPETVSISDQIAHYRAARQVIALDGSALHLFAMVGRADQQLAVILRRGRGRCAALLRHIAAFTGRKPAVIEALHASDHDKQHTGKKRLLSDLDLDAVGVQLKTAGFLPGSADWGPLNDEERAWLETELRLVKD